MKSNIFRIIQFILGLFMVIIGLNKFLVYIEIPNPPGDGGTLMQVYIKSGFLKLVGVLEMIGGLTLVTNKFVTIGLTLITAIMFNATVFHALHDMAGIGPAAICLLLCLILIYRNKARFERYFGV